MEFIETASGSVLCGGLVKPVKIYSSDTASGGIKVGSTAGAPIVVIRATDITYSNIGLCMNNDNILKDIEEVNATLAPNKKILRRPVVTQLVRENPFRFQQTNGWCGVGEKCSPTQALLPPITQRQLKTYLPAKAP